MYIHIHIYVYIIIYETDTCSIFTMSIIRNALLHACARCADVERGEQTSPAQLRRQSTQ